jgi:hypothetical protein
MSGDHFLRGVLLSGVLNFLALGAALAWCLRARLAGRAELALATIIVWNFLVMCPVYALGLTGHLHARTVALVSAPWFALVFALARRTTPLSVFIPELGRATLALARLPLDAFLVAVRARSLVALGVLFTFSMLAWTFACAYLAPSWKQWDSLWYHEPMVGFAIQNHGFAIVDLPLDVAGAQKINGYPRLGEMTQLWFVIFTDRRVIDMVGHIAPPALALGVYVLARRYTRDVTLCIALGCAIVLMPACAKLLGSTYVDAHNAAFVVAGAHFATRPTLRMRDALLAALCLTLGVGSKSTALVPAGVLSLVVTARLLRHARNRPLATVGVLALGGGLILGMAASVYFRNWRHFGNPFWPDQLFDNRQDAGSDEINRNIRLADLLQSLFGVPGSVARPWDQMFEYGLGCIWVAFPVAAIAAVVLCFAIGRDFLGLVLRRTEWRAAPETRNVAPLIVTLATVLKFSPALWGARYHTAAVGLTFALVAWVAGRRGFGALGQGVAGALTVLGMVSFFWITPRTWLWWSEAVAFAEIPFPEREFTAASEISPTLPPWNGSPVTKVAGLAREKELAPGAIVAIPGNYGMYLALFWNNEFSNRVVCIQSKDDFIAEATKTTAMWAYCSNADPTCNPLSAAVLGWEAIGPLDIEHRGTVYRRTRW